MTSNAAAPAKLTIKISSLSFLGERFQNGVVWKRTTALKPQAGLRRADEAYFIRSKFFWRICQSGNAANFSRLVLMIFASFSFFVGRLTL